MRKLSHDQAVKQLMMYESLVASLNEMYAVNREEQDALQAKLDIALKAAVTAVLPLEVLRISGAAGNLTPDTQAAINEGIQAVREALALISKAAD